MNGKDEYLEKFSVAPSPSRDYYGLRVFDDQVTLYLWRISHGPHKTPIVRTSGFVDFKQDLLLRDEIRRIFGECWLKHVQDIASGKNTLLTLPKSLIERLIKYFTVQDVVKLSSLSHISNEIFNANFVWQALYKNYKPSARIKCDSLHTRTYNWKQLFQLAQMQGLTSEQKMLRTRPATKLSKPNPKLENSIKSSVTLISSAKSDPKIENLTKFFHSNAKAATKVVPPENPLPKKLSENPRKRGTQILAARKMPDNRQYESAPEKEKLAAEKRVPVIKSIQTIGQRNIKTMRELSIAAKNCSKREIDSRDLPNNKTVEGRAGKMHNKVKTVDANSSNSSIKAFEEKSVLTKAKNSTTTKTTKIDKTPARSVHGDQAKSKTKVKAKKIGQSKSTIFNRSSALVNDRSGIRDDTFDLADLIEASLKNIRSPRSIFDYSFSCIEKPKSCGGDTKAQDIIRKMADHPRALKSAQIKATLDRLSEKSEPLTAKSTGSVNTNSASNGSTTPRSAKLLTIETKRSAVSNKNSNKPGATPLETKYPALRVQSNNIEQKKAVSRKELVKTPVLRSFSSKMMHGKSTNSPVIPEACRIDLKKTIDNVYKCL